MKIENLRELLIDELRDLYSAENQLTKALPKVAKAATKGELKKAIEHHLKETEGHVQRLEEIFEKLKESPKGKTCAGMKGLIEEADERIGEGGEPDAMDAGLIADAQRVEHYEISAYGSARTFANLLGEKQIVQLLEATLKEEKAADAKLNSIAEETNVEAKAA
ncbi:MAG TPA: ferritin-like domain-containing protein [Acidobacteriaceae bacterium]|jgi:ferritin-like metal-binding protein YciE|nr:ferritin-like domain-containing protein [Acidobacteriaceae bacterium]